MRVVQYQNLPDSFFEYKDDNDACSRVKKILYDVKIKGDWAVVKYTRQFDSVSLKNIRVNPEEIVVAYKRADKEFLQAITIAGQNIRRFSQHQFAQISGFRQQVVPGVIAEQRVIPMQRIGIYVPGGRYPLVSTMLMCAIPAQVVGVQEIVVCSRPGENGTVSPAILAAAKLLGLRDIYRVGGAQAIAAMAYGTESVKKVDKIVGPGNRYVTQAKKEVYGIVGIDFIAGPSEIMIIADRHAEPKIVAADLIAQAEHDVDAVPLLVTDSRSLAFEVLKEARKQLTLLKTRETAKKSLAKNGMIILVKNMDEAVEIANKKAPEHLELQVKNPSELVDKLRNYGSLFIGKYAAGVLGDYSSGLNHTLPTNQATRYTGGLSVRDFVKIQTLLKVTKKGLASIGGVAEAIARVEGLDGHAQAVKIRSGGSAWI